MRRRERSVVRRTPPQVRPLRRHRRGHRRSRPRRQLPARRPSVSLQRRRLVPPRRCLLQPSKAVKPLGDEHSQGVCQAGRRTKGAKSFRRGECTRPAVVDTRPADWLLKTGCCRSRCDDECQRTPIPDLGRPHGRLAGLPRNLTFTGCRDRRRRYHSATTSCQRLLPLAANWSFRPLAVVRPVFLNDRKVQETAVRGTRWRLASKRLQTLAHRLCLSDGLQEPANQVV